MQTIEEENWFYILERDEKTDDYFLEVDCGTVAIFTIRIKLNETEIAEYKRDKQTIKTLANQIQYTPDYFLNRKI